MKRLSYALPVALAGALAVGGLATTQQALKGAAAIENQIHAAHPVAAGDIAGDPLFDNLRPGLEAVRDTIRAAYEASEMQAGRNRAKTCAQKAFDEIRTLSQREEPVDQDRVLDALTCIAQAGGFDKAGIHPQDFKAYTGRGLRKQIAKDFATAKELKAQNSWNTREIARVRQEIELLGGYEAAGITPEELKAQHHRGFMEGVETTRANLDRWAHGTHTALTVFVSSVWGNFKACGAFLTGGAPAFTASQREHFAQRTKLEMRYLARKEREHRDFRPLNAFITAAGGLDSAGLSPDDYRATTGRIFPKNASPTG